MRDCVATDWSWVFPVIVQAGSAVISFIDPQFSDQIVKTQQTLTNRSTHLKVMGTKIGPDQQAIERQ